MQYELDPQSPATGDTSLWSILGGAASFWAAITKPVSPYPPATTQAIRCIHTANGAIQMPLTSQSYRPFTSCTIYLAYHKDNTDANGADVAGVEGNNRTIQFQLKLNDVVIYTSAIYTTSLTPQNAVIDLPLNSFSGWGALAVNIIAGGSTGGGGGSKRAPCVSWFKVVFEGEESTPIEFIPAEEKVYQPVQDVWLDRATLWGYNHTVFTVPAPGESITPFITFGIKKSGVFNPYPVLVKIGDKFLPVALTTVVRFFLNPAKVVIASVWTLDLVGTEFNYTVKSGDSLDSVINYFFTVITMQGYDCEKDLVAGSLSIESSAARFITMPSVLLLDKKILPKFNKIKELKILSNWSIARSVSTEPC